jgi:hypothetical protein
MGIAKICGMLTDKTELTTRDVSKMGMAEVEAALREVVGDKMAEAILREANLDPQDPASNVKKFVPRG